MRHARRQPRRRPEGRWVGRRRTSPPALHRHWGRVDGRGAPGLQWVGACTRSPGWSGASLPWIPWCHQEASQDPENHQVTCGGPLPTSQGSGEHPQPRTPKGVGRRAGGAQGRRVGQGIAAWPGGGRARDPGWDLLPGSQAAPYPASSSQPPGRPSDHTGAGRDSGAGHPWRMDSEAPPTTPAAR